MDPRTGMLYEEAEISEVPQALRDRLIAVTRDLTAKETAEKQIRLYAECGCGSGKKFKFCCYTKDK